MPSLTNYSANSQYIVKAFSALFGAGVTGDLVAAGDTLLTAGTSKVSLINALMNNSVVLNSFPLYGANITNEAFAGALLDNLTKGSGVDATTLAGWKTAVAAAIPSYASRAAAVTALIDAVAGYTGSDANLAKVTSVLNNRAEVGAFAAQNGASTFSTLAALQTQVTNVDTTAASVTAAQTSNTNISGATYALTTGVDTITANASNNTIDASRIISSGVAYDGLGNADSIDGGAGTDTLFVQNVTAAASITPLSLKNVEVLKVENMAAGTYALNLANADSSVKTVQVANTTAGTVTVSNNPTAFTNLDLNNVTQGVTITSAATAVAGTTDALAVSLSSVTGAPAVSVAGYETVTITSNGSVANALGTLTDSSLATLKIAGAQDVSLTLAATTTALATIDASTATGKVSVTLDAAQTVVPTAITGGAGNDTINMSGTYATTDVINGGAGTDTLTLTNAEAKGATVVQTNVSNVEVIALSDTTDGNAISLTNFGATGLQLGAAVSHTNNVVANFSAGTNSFNRAGSTDAANETTTLTVAGVATTDVMNVTLGNSTTASVWNGTGAFTINGAETVNVSTLFGAATIGGTLTLTNTAAAETVNITGAQSLTITGVVTADVINASGMTGAATLTLTGGTGANGVTITGTANGDSLKGGTGSDIISAGAGVDTVVATDGDDVITLGSGADILSLVGATAATDLNAATGSKVTDFTAGTDKILLDKSDLGLNGTVGNGTLTFFNGAASNAIAATAYDVVVLSAVGYTGVGTAEDAVAGASSSATKGIVIFFDTTLGYARGYYDADIDADGNLTDTAAILNFTNITTVGGLASITAADFNMQA